MDARVRVVAVALSLAGGTAACSGTDHAGSSPTLLPPSPSADPSATETPFAVVIDKSRPLLLNQTGTNGAAFDVRLVSDAMLTVSFLCEGTGTAAVSVDNFGTSVRCGGEAQTSQFQVKRPIARLRIQVPGRWQLAVQQDR
jgi:hypothetical protein